MADRKDNPNFVGQPLDKDDPFRAADLRPFTKHDLDTVQRYRRRLPHWELPGSTYFITFRTHKSVGRPFQADITRAVGTQPPNKKAREEHTGGKQAREEQARKGQARKPALPDIVEDALWHHAGKRYTLEAYVIMPDHVHILIKPLEDWSLAKIMQGLKGYTARVLNERLGRKGPFWQDESFDHLIRHDADWLDSLVYIHDNPVQAGLVTKPEDYPYSSLATLYGENTRE